MPSAALLSYLPDLPTTSSSWQSWLGAYISSYPAADLPTNPLPPKPPRP